MRKRSTIPLLLLCFAAVLVARPVVGQTSATYINPVSGVWSAATNWLAGVVPDNGGTASFNDLIGQTAGVTVTIDTTPRTLGGLVFNGGFSTTIAASNGGSIIVAGTGLTLDSPTGLLSSPTNFFPTANTITAPITGTGTLTKTGPASVNLTATNTFTGTVNLNQGILFLNNTTANNGALGDVANGLVFDGGILGVATTALTTSRAVTVNAGGGTLRTFSAATLNGPLSGAGTLVKQLNNANLTLTANSAGFSGGLRVEGGIVLFAGNGAIGAGGDVEVGSTIQLDNTATNVANRLNGRAVSSRNGVINLVGNAAAASSEVAGQLSLLQGNTVVQVVPNGASPRATVLTFAGLTRQNNATLFVRGTGLGGPLADPVGNLVFTASPGTVVGGGGDPVSSAQASVLPFAFGNTSAALLNNSVHLSYDAATGRLVPLDPANGYLLDALGTSTATDNVNVTASATLAGPAAVNALRFAPGGNVTIDGAGVLTVNSGAVLNTSSAAVVPVVTVSAPLTAGARELVLVSTNGSVFAGTGLVVSGPVGGTGGLTRSGGGAVTLSGASTYTGPTTFAGGTTRLAPDAGNTNMTVTADGSAPSVLGQGTGPVVIAGAVRVYTSGNLVVNRDVAVSLGSTGTSGLGTTGLSANESFVVNGNLLLTDPNPTTLPATGPAAVTTINGLFNLEGGVTRPTAVTVNGVVSGTGGLRANFGAYTILNNTNTYTGPTVIGLTQNQTGSGVTAQANPEVWEIGADNAFGTGTLYWQSITPAASPTVQPLPAVGTVLTANGPRTLGNPVVLVQGLANVTGAFPLTLTGPVALNGSTNNDAVVTVGAASPLTISGVVANGNLVKNGPGTLTLTNPSNQYSGRTSIRQGVLSVAAIGDGGQFFNLGGGLAAPGYLNLSGNAPGDTGVLRYTGPGETTNRLFSITGSGGTLDASGTGPLVFGATGTVTQNIPPGSTAAGFTGFTVQPGQAVFTVSNTNATGLVVGSTVTGVTTGTLFPAGTVVTEVGPTFFRTSNPSNNGTALPGQAIRVDPTGLLPSRTLTLTGTNTGLNTLAPTLVSSANFPLGVAKTGPGTWVLTANNTYTGGTTVTAGTLLVNGQTGTDSGTGTGPVTVNGGTFGGTGRTGGAVTVNTGGTLAPGLGNAGTLVVGGSVTFNAGSVFRVGIAPGAAAAAADSGGSALPGTGNTFVNAGANAYSFTTPTVVVDVTGVAFTEFAQYSFQVGQGNAVQAGVGPTPVTGVTFTFVNNGVDVTSLFTNTAPTLTFDPGAAVNNVYLNFSPVPEPTTLLLAASAGLLAARRVRRLRS